MRMPMLFAAIAMAAGPAVAATKTPPKPTVAQIKSAQDTLSLIVSALNSDDVPQNMKDGLFGCLYENSLSTIAADASQLLQKIPKLDPKDPTARLLVVARVCGAPLPDIPPAGDKTAPKGR